MTNPNIPPNIRDETPPVVMTDDIGGDNLFTRRMAGIPGWGWILIAAGVGVIAIIWMRRKKTGTTDNSQPQVVDASGLATSQAETIYSQLRDLQGRPSVPGPPGPPGTPGDTGPAGPPGTTPAPAGHLELGAPGPQTNLYDWISQQNMNYPGLNATFTGLFDTGLNPGFRKYITWGPDRDAGGNLVPHTNPAWSGRGLGIPPIILRQ